MSLLKEIKDLRRSYADDIKECSRAITRLEVKMNIYQNILTNLDDILEKYEKE